MLPGVALLVMLRVECQNLSGEELSNVQHMHDSSYSLLLAWKLNISVHLQNFQQKQPAVSTGTLLPCYAVYVTSRSAVRCVGTRYSALHTLLTVCTKIVVDWSVRWPLKFGWTIQLNAH